MKLSNSTLGGLPVAVPSYDRAALTGGIVHFGLGNFHRAHMAWYLDQLFEAGEGHDWALIGAGVRQGDAAMRDRLAAQDQVAQPDRSQHGQADHDQLERSSQPAQHRLSF